MLPLDRSAPPTIWQQLARRLDGARVRPRARSGVEAFPVRTASGEPYMLVRDAAGHAYLRLAPWAYALFLDMDGTRTIKDLLLGHLTRDAVLEPEAVSTLVATLHARGFLAGGVAAWYAALGERLHPPRSGERALRRSMDLLGSRWSIPFLARLFGPLWAGSALISRRLSAPHIGLLGAVLPLLAAYWRGGAVAATVSNAALLLFALWAATALYAIGGGMGCAALGHAPRRAGLYMPCGIPVFWIDTRACLIAGQRGQNAVWWGGPLALLAGGALTGLLAMLGVGWAITVALAWTFTALIALAPPGYPHERAPTVVDDAPPPRAWRWWLDPVAWWRARPRYGALLLLLWLSALGALLAAIERTNMIAIPSVLWSRTPAPILIVVSLYVAARGLPRGGARFLRRLRLVRRGATRHPTALRRRMTMIGRCADLEMLTEEQRAALATQVEEVRVPAYFDIVVQGEAGNDFYIIMEGTAEAIDESGPTVLRRYGPGETFGLYGLLYHALRAATVRATSDLHLLRLDRAVFDAFLAPRLREQERLIALAEERRILATVPLLRHLSSRELNLLLARLVDERHAPGTVIVRQGERGEHFYIVKSGAVEVIDERQTPPLRLNVLGNGDYFGEIALLTDQPRVATVRALVEVEVWRLSRADFDLVLARYCGLDTTLAGAGEARMAANRVRGA